MKTNRQRAKDVHLSVYKSRNRKSLHGSWFLHITFFSGFSNRIFTCSAVHWKVNKHTLTTRDAGFSAPITLSCHIAGWYVHLVRKSIEKKKKNSRLAQLAGKAIRKQHSFLSNTAVINLAKNIVATCTLPLNPLLHTAFILQNLIYLDYLSIKKKIKSLICSSWYQLYPWMKT